MCLPNDRSVSAKCDLFWRLATNTHENKYMPDKKGDFVPSTLTGIKYEFLFKFSLNDINI